MKKLLVAALFAAVSACETVPAVELTPLELQALQQREFETSKQIAFASTMSVFQDLGYTVNAADIDTGLINAASAANASTDFLFTGATFTTQTRATAFIEGVGENVARVRLNFVTGTQTSSAYGSSGQRDKPILDAAIYEAAFEKIETAIFVRQ